jgi:hypothetical protein
VSTTPIKVLFIPVSTNSGVGEYLRSLVIAEHLQQKYLNAEMHFILNENASYSKDCPFKTHLCNSSATKRQPADTVPPYRPAAFHGPVQQQVLLTLYNFQQPATTRRYLPPRLFVRRM